MSQMTYLPVGFMVPNYMWCWPVGYDGRTPFRIFDQHALWVRQSSMHSPNGFHMECGPESFACQSYDRPRTIWRWCDEHDEQNAARLAVWPD